jgi:hypothetical protein
MSAIIYIKSGDDDDLTSEQLELLHRYSDQAKVWAYLLLKEAGLIRSTEEWRRRRDEWLQLKNELIALNSQYGISVVRALQQQYNEKKVVAETSLPPAKNFFPPETPPEELNQATALAEKVKQDFTDLYPSRKEVGHTGPFLTDEEKTDLFSPPDITDLSDEDAEKKMKEWEERSGLDLQKWQQSGKSPVIDMVKGYATNHGTEIIDPDTGATIYDPSTKSFNEDLMEDFSQEVLLRAIKSYNPFKSEDTGEGFEGRKASFGTYLYRAMINEIKSRKDQYARNLGVKDTLPPDADISQIIKALIYQLKISPEELKSKVEDAKLTEDSSIEEWRAFYDELQGDKKFKVVKVPISLTQPIGGEESLTVEETIAEKGRKEDNPLWKNLLEPLREKLYQRVESSGGKFTAESAERMLDIYKRIFIDGQRMSGVATDLGLVVDRPRAKEIALLKQLGVDISSLPATIPPEKSSIMDREDRQRIWVKFFADIINKIESLRKQEKTPEIAKQLAAAQEKYKHAKEKLDALSTPNTGRIHNILRGDPRKGMENAPAIIPILKELSPEVRELAEEAAQLKKKQALEDFLVSISSLRAEGSLNYNLLRNKIEQKLSKENPQLFMVYTYLYESDFSNPDTARLMKLSPPRITGLKKKIISTLLDLPEVQSFLPESESDSISPLRRFIFNEGDAVRVSSIDEIGNIETSSDLWYKIRLHNGNEVFTIKEDIQKYNTLVDSAHSVLAHYFNREVVTPQCYLSFIASPRPQLVILELHPSNEINTTARLHINNNLIEITEFTEKYPDNLISIIKGHLGIISSMDTPFTPLFEEVE